MTIYGYEHTSQMKKHKMKPLCLFFFDVYMDKVCEKNKKLSMSMIFIQLIFSY